MNLKRITTISTDFDENKVFFDEKRVKTLFFVVLWGIIDENKGILSIQNGL